MIRRKKTITIEQLGHCQIYALTLPGNPRGVSVSGWGRHLICSKRFHFVLPKRELSVEADGLHYGINHSPEKPSKGTATSRGHLLHGVVHLNGFGHLVALHGFEGGSEFVAGEQIMDLWDRICSSLNVRCATRTTVQHVRCAPCTATASYECMTARVSFGYPLQGR